MIDKLTNIYGFLIENRIYNHNVQERFYSQCILPFNKKEDRIVSLLYQIANTQSQPNIDNLAKFYKKIFEKSDHLITFNNFLNLVNPGSPSLFFSLFEGMKVQNGWGLKTAALFTKAIFHLHNGKYSKELVIWDDAPNCISVNDDFQLPVDTVIISIFNRLDNSTKWNYNSINKKIKENFSGESIEVWDDLWFWGFITQFGSNSNRLMAWNESKYWALNTTDKNHIVIAEIQKKAQQFLDFLPK